MFQHMLIKDYSRHRKRALLRAHRAQASTARVRCMKGISTAFLNFTLPPFIHLLCTDVSACEQLHFYSVGLALGSSYEAHRVIVESHHT
jgi:hypothetical protein